MYTAQSAKTGHQVVTADRFGLTSDTFYSAPQGYATFLYVVTFKHIEKERWVWQRREEASIIGNFTANIFARGEKSRISCRKTRQSRRALGNGRALVRLAARGKTPCWRVKKRVEHGEVSAWKTSRRSGAAYSREKLMRDLVARVSSTITMRNTAFETVRTGGCLRAVKEVVAGRRKCRAQGRRTFLKLHLRTFSCHFFIVPPDYTSVRKNSLSSLIAWSRNIYVYSIVRKYLFWY